MKRSILVFILGSALLTSAALAQLSVRASLDGTQAGTAALGTGTAFGTFSPDLKTLSYQITVAKLSGSITGAHFHFATTGGVLTPITFAGNTAKGTWSNFPDTLLKYIFSNGIYINVHTGANPAGEIRGKLGPTQFFFTANLNGSQAGTASSALGTGYFRWKDTGGTSALQYAITFAGLTGSYTGAHFHYLPTGTVLQPITFTDSATAVGTWSGYPDSVLALLLRKQVYVNIHSSSFPAGEIRGTVTPVGSLYLVAALDSTLTGSASRGQGTAYAVLSNDLTSITYGGTYARLSGVLTGSHFHTTTNGGVIKPVTFTGNSTTGTWTGFSDVNLQDLLRGRVYMNLHTGSFPAGEIRGTLNNYEGVFTATLNGAQAGTSSTGSGTAWFHFGTQSDSGYYRVTFAGLSGSYTGSHFHLLPAGNVVKSISTSDSTTGSGAWLIPDSMTAAMVRGNMYVNVHSSSFPAGDIRGTLTASPGTASGVLQVSQNPPSSFALDQNYPNPFNPSTSITFSLRTSTRATLRIYNLLGQEVATLMDGPNSAGSYKVNFDAHALASGIYLYRLTTGDGFTSARKMLLLK